MKQTIARVLSERIVASAVKSVGSRKTIVGSMPVPQELKKGV